MYMFAPGKFYVIFDMKKYSFFAPAALLLLLPFLFSCKSEKTFEVRGTLSSADKETLFLEHRGLGGTETLDSIQLDGKGAFRFRKKAPENPEFYQLKINGQAALFVVDSTEKIEIKGDAKNLAATFSVENSPVNDRIRQIDGQTQKVKAEIDRAEKAHAAKSIGDADYLSQLDSILKAYKAEATRLILSNPGGADAYYAIFQKVNDYLIFDPYNKQDYAMFGAVATSWSRYYPETLRTRHLYDFAMNALKTRRQREQQAAVLENVQVITDSALPDIVLTNVKGEKVPLSAQKGKVVILDFTLYKSDFSPKHNIGLNKIYTQYKSKGLEIYQISFDSDEHLWKNAAHNLPWITVRDPGSVYSRLLSMYNVRNLPTAFVVNRNGDVAARIEDYGSLEKEVSKAL